MEKESVWDYPRPPRVEPSQRRVRVVHSGVSIADSVTASRVLETSHPPVYYLPPADVDLGFLRPNPRRTFCEYKGTAIYWDLVQLPAEVTEAAWSYPEPSPGYEELQDLIAFYPGRVDACYLDNDLVIPQEGGFYGGWITSEIVGPFKGGAGSQGW